MAVLATKNLSSLKIYFDKGLDTNSKRAFNTSHVTVKYS